MESSDSHIELPVSMREDAPRSPGFQKLKNFPQRTLVESERNCGPWDDVAPCPFLGKMPRGAGAHPRQGSLRLCLVWEQALLFSCHPNSQLLCSSVTAPHADLQEQVGALHKESLADLPEPLDSSGFVLQGWPREARLMLLERPHATICFLSHLRPACGHNRAEKSPCQQIRACSTSSALSL